MYSLKDKNVVVAGAGGFIGGWLVHELIRQGCSNVIACDLKPLNLWHQSNSEVNNTTLDLSLLSDCRTITKNADVVFNLAADMGGMGFIELNKAACMLSVLINTHLLKASVENSVQRFFFASSACVYRGDLQRNSETMGLKESDAYPADPEDGYGWEKLFSERMCRHFMEDYGLQTRVARYHNVYGPHGTYHGGREKAPAAICRKVAEAIISGSSNIEIWGDGEQTRSFTFIDDTIRGTIMLTTSEVTDPVNIGSSEMISINQLVSYVETIAGVNLARTYDLDAPKGVRGRNSDNSKIIQLFDWEPTTPLQFGLEKTYSWIYSQCRQATR